MNYVFDFKKVDELLSFDKSQTREVEEVKTKEIYDVSGAGDTVIACLAAAIINGKSIRDAVELSNNAAGIVVTHMGTSAITLNELEIT